MTAPAESIADLKARTSLVDVIRRYTALKQRRRGEWWGCCPFHGDRTPSFKVDAARGFYLGKSARILERLADAIARGEVREVWYFAPDGRICAELAEKAHDLGLPAYIVRGREAAVGGEPLCRKSEVAAKVARAGLPVTTTLCRSEGPDGGEQLCPFFHQCHYLRQFRPGGPAIRFFPHSYLALADHLPRLKPLLGLPKPDLIIIDESFALGMARHASFGIDRLTTPRAGMKPELEAEVLATAVKVRGHLERGLDPREAADTDAFRRIAAIEATPTREEVIWPMMRWEEQRRRAEMLRRAERHTRAAFWRTLAAEAERGGPLQRIALRRNEPGRDGEAQDRIHVWWRARLALPDVPVIALDASLDERIARKFLPRIEARTISARRNAEVIQVVDTACSRNRLLSFDGAPEAERRRAASRLEDVRRLAEVEVAKARRERPDARVLVVTYKAAEERLLEQGPIVGVDAMHLGALHGIDRYKGHDTVIVAGREQPSLRGRWNARGQYKPGVEDYALSLFGDDEQPLALVQPDAKGERRFTPEIRGYRTRDGSRRGAKVETYPDPRCQAVLEQVREREIEQAIDRLRLIHRPRPARVILLSNVVVDVTVDHLVAWREVVPDRLAIAFAWLDGVLPLAPAWLAGRFPDLWTTGRAAEHDLQRSVKGTQTPNKESYLGFGYLSALYRVVGQRGSPSSALLRADHPDAEAALAALVGPLAMFQREDEPPTPPARERPDAVSPSAAGPRPPLSRVGRVSLGSVIDDDTEPPSLPFKA